MYIILLSITWRSIGYLLHDYYYSEIVSITYYYYPYLWYDITYFGYNEIIPWGVLTIMYFKDITYHAYVPRNCSHIFFLTRAINSHFLKWTPIKLVGAIS